MILDVLRRSALPASEDDLLILSNVRDGVDGNRITRKSAERPLERSHHRSPRKRENDDEKDDDLPLETEPDEVIEEIHRASPACSCPSWGSDATSVSVSEPHLCIIDP